jgi:tetratricopeptide (TPR) repeat protein
MNPAMLPKSSTSRLGRLALLSCFGLALSLPCIAQPIPPAAAQLPPAAQQSIAKGLTAAKQQQWLVAIRAFEEARAAAPDSPIPLYNLGLAEAQMPGRELRAICWFEAYLALAPNADNAAAVRQEIVSLDARAADNVRKIIELLKSSSDTASVESVTMSLLIRMGNFDEAETLLNQSDKSDEYRREMAQFLSELGRYAEAMATAEKIKRGAFNVFKPWAYEDIASTQIKAGLFPEAKTALDKLSSIEPLGQNRFHILFQLAEAEYISGQHEEAVALLHDAREIIDKFDKLIEDSHRKSSESERIASDAKKSYLILFAVAQSKMGEPAAGEALLRQVEKSMGDLKDVKSSPSSPSSPYRDRMNLLCELAQAANKLDQNKKASQFLKEAEEAANASRKAKEMFFSAFFNRNYLLIRDWDGLRALALRQAKSGMQGQTAHVTADVNADWLAYTEKTIVDTKRSIADAAAKSSSIKTLANTAASPLQRALAWSNFMKATMSAPIFTDFKGTLDGFSTYVPKKNAFINTSVFTKVLEQAELILNRLGDIHVLQAKQIRPIKD